jgi:hypothetical protein
VVTYLRANNVQSGYDPGEPSVVVPTCGNIKTASKTQLKTINQGHGANQEKGYARS